MRELEMIYELLSLKYNEYVHGNVTFSHEEMLSILETKDIIYHKLLKYQN